MKTASTIRRKREWTLAGLGGSALCLDMASAVGYASGITGGDKPRYGTVRFGDGASIGAILDGFDEWLWDLLDENRIDYIFYEAPYLSKFAGWKRTQILYGLSGLVLRACFRQKIIPQRVTTNQAMAALGVSLPRLAKLPKETKEQLRERRRAAKKAATIAACEARGWPVSDDNAADALAIWCFAENALNASRHPPASSPAETAAGTGLAQASFPLST
jgi:hypothetical protein